MTRKQKKHDDIRRMIQDYGVIDRVIHIAFDGDPVHVPPPREQAVRWAAGIPN